MIISLRETLSGTSTFAFAVFIYFLSSSSLLLVNKITLKHIPSPAAVTSVQYLFTALFVLVASRLGLIDARLIHPLPVLLKYLVVPVSFSLAIFSNAKILESANVETFMVFRFSTPVLVGLSDFLFMGKAAPGFRSTLSFVLITAGACVYTVTDKGFELTTYKWAMFYLGIITFEMIIVKHVFNTIKMTAWTRVFLNNAMSLIFLQPILILATSEQNRFRELKFTLPGLMALVVACVLGLGLAWSGTYVRAGVGATTFTVLGVACKVVTELANWLMWDKHASVYGVLALAVCLLGSTLFVPSPVRDESTTYSNMVWSALNTLSCGLLKAAELESTTFHAGATQQYQAVATDTTLGEGFGKSFVVSNLENNDVEEGIEIKNPAAAGQFGKDGDIGIDEKQFAPATAKDTIVQR